MNVLLQVLALEVVDLKENCSSFWCVKYQLRIRLPCQNFVVYFKHSVHMTFHYILLGAYMELSILMAFLIIEQK